jgi:hypothetical protein
MVDRAGGWGAWFRSGPTFPSFEEIEDGPLELQRAREHQDRPWLVQSGIERMVPGYQEYWLPQRMAQQQWKKDDNGNWRNYDSSAQTYIQASLVAPQASPRGGSTTRLPMLRPPRRGDSFQQYAVDFMQQGIVRFDRKPQVEPGFAISRNVPPPQLLPSDLHALEVYEDCAIGAAQLAKSQETRQAINELRAYDKALWAQAYGGKHR